MLSLEDLPLDIRDRLLIFLPDFQSLRCAVLSSAYLLEAYEARKKSIFHAVLENEVGPALSHATALIRVKTAVKNKMGDKALEKLNDLNSDCWDPNVLVNEAYELSSVASTVNRLEAHFSMRYKDRTAVLSTLEFAEQQRFHKAAYLLWILAILAYDRHSRMQAGLNLSFLSSLADDELCAVEETMRFLDELLRTCGIRERRPGSARPATYLLDNVLYIFDGYGTSYGPWPDHWVPGATFGRNIVITTELEALWSRRKVETLFTGKHNSQCILTNARVEYVQACQKCGSVHEEILFSQNNWNWAQTRIPTVELRTFFPGKLSLNDHVMTKYYNHISAPHHISLMLADMYACQNDPGSGWNKDDWVCLECLKRFIRENILSWFVRRLVLDGEPFKENCWYGYNCRTQVHRWEHASKLNHLCEPSNRDDTYNQNQLQLNHMDDEEPAD